MSRVDESDIELLIIRRNRAAEADAAKSSGWKIAYADFMTAMMAFFLVMWLVNSTSETTKTGVANYFNPIKLSDRMMWPEQGLHDAEEAELGHADPASTGEDPEPSTAANPAEAAGGAPAMHDPYAALVRGATGGGGAPAQPGAADAAGRSGPIERAGDDPLRDPFDPVGWAAPAPPTPATSGGPAGADAAPAAPAAARGRAGEGPEETRGEPATGPATAGFDRPGRAPEGDARPGAWTGEAATDSDATAQAAALRDRIADALADAAGARGRAGDAGTPDVAVARTSEGVLISLADTAGFGMFAIGSAEPLPEAVAAMRTIGELLRTMPGHVVISGHTDARPFRAASYDNWRLSSDRAWGAYRMLVQGGLDEARIERIEGRADRDPRLPDDPQAAGNRRIDILIREARP